MEAVQAIRNRPDQSNRNSCHGPAAEEIEDDLNKIVLVGSPNVGKSVVFGNLTGKYVVVSNYPGTTVEVTRGRGSIGGRGFQIIDTPGMYSLHSITEEERVARSMLLMEKPDTVIQVADAKNIERMLHLTLQLIEADMPVVLDLNLMDEAEAAGMEIDLKALEKELHIPVLASVATEGRGMDLLRERIAGYRKESPEVFKYDDALETAIQKVEKILPCVGNFSGRSIALLLLQEDPGVTVLVRERMGDDYGKVEAIVREAEAKYRQPLNYVITLARQEEVNRIIGKAVAFSGKKKTSLSEGLSRMTMHPLAGSVILLMVLYGLYEFVGVLGAQILVDFLENGIFGKYINPFVTDAVASIIPWKVVQELFVHQYGIITLGIRYAIAIILPIVATFFIAFSIIEDTGYLPRLAMLIDRLFKMIGLNGRAVIPIVLGFGCDTMATMVTRTLETKRERIIATFLLALAVPCSAQVGVILALLAGHPKALGIFAGVMALIFLLTGYLMAKLMPGEKPMFYMEIPSLRWPKLSNVLTKTYTRVEWYFKEILPLFILASIFIWTGKVTGVFDLIVNVLSYPVSWIGLPGKAAEAFLYGFFRRDFGAAGLYDLKEVGLLSGVPLVVSVVTLALFMPCIAQLSMTIKERGMKLALGMAAFIFPFAFLVGGMLNQVLILTGVRL
jgi:ferrous iron transport protein B